MPPRNLWELLVNVKKGTYLPQTYIIQEEMIATEHVSDMEQLGSFIYRLCSGKETYRLKRRSTRRRISRREAGDCHRIRHFENTFVVETVICKKSWSPCPAVTFRGFACTHMLSALFLDLVICLTFFTPSPACAALKPWVCRGLAVDSLLFSPYWDVLLGLNLCSGHRWPWSGCSLFHPTGWGSVLGAGFG